ncbi:MAG: aminotransferase class I/II-fold pyridoxal phosphate-dependent enzyme [Alphaproteobacteria bacterium]|nr:aminotransferase class I/II-fold pyridoxal phosphate-dependent enzyme [Alphaproteobacteria bacterium]
MIPAPKLPPMSKAESLNAVLAAQAPAAAAMLSPLGRAFAFPAGIPAQSYEAAGCELRATIGQLTDGGGRAMPLAALSRHLGDVSQEQAFLYAHAAGLKPLREAWWRRISAEAGAPAPRCALPVVTAGITHALSICADLFADEDTDVVIARPFWGNYNLLFGTRRGARVLTYSFFDEAGERFNVEGLRRTLGQVRRKAIVIINFPSNPTGYTPNRAEVEQILRTLTEHEGPSVVILDDAYHGWIYDDEAVHESLFWELLRRRDPSRLLPVKADGATKELLFFGGRTAFLTFGEGGEAGEALVDKAMTSIRGAINHAPAPSQALALAALQDPELEAQIAYRLDQARHRYAVLKAALAELDTPLLRPYPFNGGFFAMIGVDPSIDVETLRRRLIAEQSLGLISLPDVNALRIAFCSVEAEDLPEVVRRMAAGVRA